MNETTGWQESFIGGYEKVIHGNTYYIFGSPGCWCLDVSYASGRGEHLHDKWASINTLSDAKRAAHRHAEASR